MASLRVHPDRLEIQLTPAEKALALRRAELSVPRSAIRSVTITDDPWIWIRGIRAPGTLVPLVLAVGTWKFHGGKDFLVIKNKRQAVIIDITDGEYARLIVSTNHAAELVNALNVSSDDAAAQVDAEAQADADAAAGALEPAVEATAMAAKPRAARASRAAKPAKAPAAAKPVKPAKEPAADKAPAAAKAAKVPVAAKAVKAPAAAKAPKEPKAAKAPRVPRSAQAAATTASDQSP
ncbi:hypothetical protein [Microterricola viridarii]|uniref:hypothetical protein n=1 Tax=Microterricola viridarii TaxID=412690 RepID=UPI000B137888|nr:hypothetical protein [Microterricola viridarii]